MMLSPLVQAGALQNSQSPVDTEGNGDSGSMEPFRVRRWSKLLTLEKLNTASLSRFTLKNRRRQPGLSGPKSATRRKSPTVLFEIVLPGISRQMTSG
jgi:hypothetical protein